MRSFPVRSRDVARSLALGLAALVVVAMAAVAGERVELAIPEGVLPLEIPADNPLTAERVALGKKLYFDARLSTDETVACATCHDPRTGFADGRGTPTSAGVGGSLGARNAPTTLNAAFLQEQFWDGRAPTLEAQAVLPLINPIEHGFADHPAVVARIESLADYRDGFVAAFGSDQITIERVGQALAGFERTLISLAAPIDRFLAGDGGAISTSAQRGWALYNGKARCNTCHGHISVLPLFTDESTHNIGVGVQKPGFEALARKALADPDSISGALASHPALDELGRFKISKEPAHLGGYRTPHLRNVALTAPYMHDGSEPTLASVIDYYDRGGNANPWIDGGMRPLGLTGQEKADLVALMETFTSEDLDRFADLADLMP